MRHSKGMVIDGLALIGLVVLYLLYDWTIERAGHIETRFAHRAHPVQVVGRGPRVNRLRLVAAARRVS